VKVHITQGDYDGRAMIISWVTPQERHPSVVTFWAAGSKHKHKSHSSISTYRYFSYNSGYIHHATIKHLEVSNGFSIPSICLDYWILHVHCVSIVFITAFI
jgi:hypothetical protein